MQESSLATQEVCVCENACRIGSHNLSLPPTVLSLSGTLMISTELKEEESGSTVLGSIELPESLFIALTDKEEEEENELGVWFSLHKTAHLFSPMDSLSENNSVSTPVISATVGGHSVEGLDEDDPIIITLRLLNQVCVCVCVCVWVCDVAEHLLSGCYSSFPKALD